MFNFGGILWSIFLIIIILILSYQVFIYFYPEKEINSYDRIVELDLEEKESIEKVCKEDICESYFSWYLDSKDCYCYDSKWKMVYTQRIK